MIGPLGNPLAPKDFLSAPPAPGSSDGVLGRVDKGSIATQEEIINSTPERN